MEYSSARCPAAADLSGAISPYVEIHETHTGIVVLVGDKAYKAKKPIKTDFVDLSTPERREWACVREVALNSRLAPDSYLGVAHLSDPTGGPEEPVIVMRRYPDSCRLATLVKRGAAVRGELEQIAEVLAHFHDRVRQQQADHGDAVSADATVGAISARWEENLHELERYAGVVVPADLIGQIGALARRYVAGRAPLFTRRIADARIVDGHGDLLADDIFCLPGGPALLDCLEFDDHLRYVDGVDDAAFLAMDLEFLGRKDLADYFLETYSRLAGDDAPDSLKHLYIAYRAVVRAKVECLRFTQGNPDSAADASRHLSLALAHLQAGAVRVALIGGAPGTGKTTLARALAERVGAEVISTDEVRRELRQEGRIEGETGMLDAGLYRPEKVAAVYDEVIRRARACLEGGWSVILDGTWRNPRHRGLAHQLATATASALVEIVCWTPVDASVQRVRHRLPGASEATPEIAEALAIRDDAWNTAHPIDTSRASRDCTDEAETLWRNLDLTALPDNLSE